MARYDAFGDAIAYSDQGKKLTLKMALVAHTHSQVGQFVVAFLPTVSGVEAHPFSLTSAPSDAYYEFCVRNLGDYTDAFVKKLRMVEGDRKERKLFASIEGPYGSLALPYADYRVLSFVAGGIGKRPPRAAGSGLSWREGCG